jgi:hypothetical protein
MSTNPENAVNVKFGKSTMPNLIGASGSFDTLGPITE